MVGLDIVRKIAVIALVCAGALLSFSRQASAATSGGDTFPSEPRFIHFGAEQGLSSTINDLALDRQGYVWVATGDGLARYDGTKFQHWRRIVGDAASLPDNEVTLIHVDAHDRLWAATWFALSVLDPDHRVPRKIEFRGDAERCGIDITAMTSTPEGVVWLGNYAGDLCTIGLDGVVVRLHSEKGESSFFGISIPVAIAVLPSGSLLVGTDKGLLRVEPNYPNKIPEIVHEESTGGDPVFKLSTESNGMVWVGAERGLFLVSPAGERASLAWAPPKKSRRAVVVRSRDGNHWVGSYYGLFRRNSSFPLTVNEDSGYGVDSGVSAIIEDREAGIWIASNSQGLLYLPPNDYRFSVSSKLNFLDWKNIVGADIDGEGVLWVLAIDGIYKYKKNWKGIFLNERKIFSVKDPVAVRACKSGMVLILDSKKVFVFNSSSDNPNIFRYDFKSSFNRGEAIACNSYEKIWISLFGGGILFFSENGILIDEFTPEETLSGETGAFIDLRFSPDGSPWYSDGKDLRRWDGHRFVRVVLPAGEYVYSLDFASSSQLWVARFGSLERYEWDGARLRLRERAGAEEGLPAVEARSVLVTATGNIWLNTVRGLVLYDSKQRRARLFGLRDGLPGLDFTLDVLKRKPGGAAVAISKEGVVVFDPDRPLPVPQVSELAVEAIELRRGEDTVRFSRRGNVSLHAVMRAGDRDLRIVSRVMSFADPAAYRYRSRLHGYDPDWVDQGERGERVFSSLPSGRYVLDMQGANADGVWSATRKIAIVVEAPWWRRWWALMCYAIAASILLYWAAYLYRLRLRRRHEYQMIAQKREVAEQASQAKSRFLANLGHEVRTPMTGVLGMSELLLSTSLDTKQQGHVRAIRHAGEHLLRLVNDALDLARIEAGRLELDVVDFELDAVVDEVAGLMRPLAERKGLALRIDVAQDGCGEWRGDPTRIRQILLNLIGNAVKFTEHGEVALSIGSAVPHGLKMVVSDTGPGLDSGHQQRLFRRFEQAEGARTASRYGGSGLGLAICQELAVAMGGSIELRSAPGEGAEFTVRLALERATTTGGRMKTPHCEKQPTVAQVLLVEDDMIVADVLSGMLQAQGHVVVHAVHALAAMSEIATRGFDIALLDLDLPGMDGLALARHLRGQGMTLPMVAITARADSGAESEAERAGFDAFLRKPLTGDALADALRDLFAKRDSEA